MKKVTKTQEIIENLLQGKTRSQVAYESRKHNRKIRLMQINK